MTREDKWRQNYIENLDLQNITCLTLEKDAFLKFINQNYFDEELGRICNRRKIQKFHSECIM